MVLHNFSILVIKHVSNPAFIHSPIILTTVLKEYYVVDSAIYEIFDKSML